MALTEEQRRIAQQVAMESPSPQYEEDLVTFAERFLAALPKPEVVEDFIYRFKRHVGGDGEFWLHELEDFYTESTIAQPASAPSEQKPAAHLSEIYEQMETPFNKLLSAQQRHFLFENEYELKYLPIYADQPDPTYIVKWVWEVRDKHGASVAEAHEWMYQAINNAQVDAIASVKGGE